MTNGKFDISEYKGAIQYGVVIVVFAIVLFASSGTLDWMSAWVYVFIWGGSLLAIGINLLVNDPEALQRDGNIDHGNEEADRFDQVLMVIFGVMIVIGLALAGFDHRENWTRVTSFLQIAGLAAMATALFIFAWAKTVNPFLPTKSRLRYGGGVQIVNSGPYHYLRHPTYLATMLMALGTPLYLDSYVALIPAAIIVGIFLVRTYVEDKDLRHNLPGYDRHAKRVKYRIIPRIW